MFITCSTNPSLVTQETVDIVKEVNCHCCTSKCASACKYGFPRFPLKDTIMIDKNEPKNSTVEDKEKILNRENILRKVREVLKDDDKLETIFKKYPEKGETLEDDYYFRSQRIEELLKVAGDISYEDYVISLKCMKNNGSTVLIKRDIDEIYVNNYNQEWITNWNANMDIQIVLDYFGLITYVTDYWAKADEGLTPILREAAKQLKAEPEQKKRAQEMANTFISHRQMGEAEAYYKILPNLTLKYSNVDTVFVPTDKKELRSRFLMKIDDTHENFLLGTTVKGGREGRFLEKRDIIDKYCRRDLDLNEHLKNLCLSQFAKMYEPINATKIDTDNDQTLLSSTLSIYNEQNNVYDDEHEISNFIIKANEKETKVYLPEIIRISNPLPGELSIWKKRRFPKAMQIHKKKRRH